MFPSAWRYSRMTFFPPRNQAHASPVELSATELTSRISALRVMSCSACPVQPRAVGCSIALTSSLVRRLGLLDRTFSY